ncbi:hypothetical protein fugu_009626 [Takifugu bimaculatus]|uniref:Uncharacterized protein n=1 Tax=Takifugu bimaculatus TaxID=433685 RepID=A0A4Z2CD61_9TELE|nr:hypothetical protein fugu_009626 [Takifugu bimaculatus]
MPVTVSTADGVTVLTLTSDPNSSCPPLCQILKGLCYSPKCCTMSQQLKENQGTSQSTLGTLHIVIGLLNIGFSVILCTGSGASWDIRETYFPFWFGAVFIFLGAMCIFSERRPSPGLVFLNVTLNIVGFAFACGCHRTLQQEYSQFLYILDMRRLLPRQIPMAKTL